MLRLELMGCRISTRLWHSQKADFSVDWAWYFPVHQVSRLLVLLLRMMLFGAFLSLSAIVCLESRLMSVDATPYIFTHDHRRGWVFAGYLRAVGCEIRSGPLVLLLVMKERVLEGRVARLLWEVLVFHRIIAGCIKGPQFFLASIFTIHALIVLEFLLNWS